MYEIIVEGSFCATHALRSPGAVDEPVHGHDWHVTVRLAADTLDAAGCVADFHDVQGVLDRITRGLNHTHLNEHPWLAGENPTAEKLARVVFDRLAQTPSWGDKVSGVTVTEAPGCAARYAPS